jgi:hypothetical protein
MPNDKRAAFSVQSLHSAGLAFRLPGAHGDAELWPPNR